MEPDPFTSFTMEVRLAPVPVIHLRGWLDHWATPRFRTQAAHLLLTCPRSVVLECGELTGIDAAGLRALLDLRRRLPADGELVVVGASPLLRRLVALTGLERHVHLAAVGETSEVALAGGEIGVLPPVDLGIGSGWLPPEGEGCPTPTGGSRTPWR